MIDQRLEDHLTLMQQAENILDARVIDELRAELGDEIVGQVLNASIIDIHQAGRQCAAALSLRRGEQARQAAHALAGVAVGIGALSLAAAAQGIERALAHGEQPGTHEATRLDHLVETTMIAVERELVACRP